ncbi:hypothetical protein TRV_01195 [Trichophyton verrucosum HKI 0517]|uniref:Uncharacterized protein n=1 Tax=Trichophyton verrucosum (strain HKI 0517) TaxID=663202 RepID=D4D292_TRIVH|nr:uncharacterized protein TRV_01195 [Trichophyton verrucosum HKI 0517]EFE44015.1 hypothetical protein TRV_01195 [Trichophyton verrucosum HKI 0517]
MWPKGEAEAEVDEDEDSNRTEDGDEDEDDGDKETMKIRRRERQEATAWLRLLSFLLLSGFRRVSASARKQKRQDRSKWPASGSEEVEEAKGTGSQEDRGSRIEDEDKTLLAVQTVQFIYLHRPGYIYNQAEPSQRDHLAAASPSSARRACSCMRAETFPPAGRLLYGVAIYCSPFWPAAECVLGLLSSYVVGYIIIHMEYTDGPELDAKRYECAGVVCYE